MFFGLNNKFTIQALSSNEGFKLVFCSVLECKVLSVLIVLNWFAVHKLVTNLQALTKAKYMYFHIYFQKEPRIINKQFETFALMENCRI
jgi:hypothetical protein